MAQRDLQQEESIKTILKNHYIDKPGNLVIDLTMTMAIPKGSMLRKPYFELGYPLDESELQVQGYSVVRELGLRACL